MVKKEIGQIIGEYPVVNFNEIVRRVNSREYAKQVVQRMINKKQLTRIKKGLFTASNNALSVSSNIYCPSYISFLAASQYYGLTEIIPRVISVVTPNRYKPVEFKNYKIEFVYLNKIFGYHKKRRGKEVIVISDLEKLMIDAFLKPKHMGNFEEIKNVFKNAGHLDKKKLVEYLKKINSKKIYCQVWYMTEKYCKLDIKGALQINKNYHDLNPFLRGKKINTKWRLRI